jgi:hypothetical protein
MIARKLAFWSAVMVLIAGCAAPGARALQGAPSVAAAAPTATRTRQRSTPTPEAMATATESPTVAPTATAPATATATPLPTPTATVQPINSAIPPAYQPAAPRIADGGLLLAIDPHKYPTPTLLTPGDNATYHVSQPVVHMAWSATPTDLLAFGQTPGCVSDATNFRRAYESYQLIIHSLDVSRPDQVQWTANNPSYDLNLTTVPAGRYTWKVNVVTLCESYEVGQRNDTRPLYDNRNNDPAYHKSTLETTLVGAVSPTSETRTINWVP